MQPEKLKYLDSFDKFYRMLVNQVKENKINEKDFYMIIKAKAKSMDQDRREKMSKKTIVKVIGVKRKPELKNYESDLSKRG